MSDAEHRAILFEHLFPNAKKEIIINLINPFYTVFTTEDRKNLLQLKKKGVKILFLVLKKTVIPFDQKLVNYNFNHNFITIDGKSYWYQEKNSEEATANFNDPKMTGELNRIAKLISDKNAVHNN